MALLCWVVASPPGSSPDEPYHLSSIWCGQGIETDTCLAGPASDVRVVPAQVAQGPCFVGKPVSADCRPSLIERPMRPDQPTDAGNWTGAYPPLYYAFMHTFILGTVDSSVLLMRAVNVLIAVGLIGGLTLLLPRRLQRLPALTFVVTAVPVSVFFLASVNPTGWTLLSAGTLWLAVYSAFEASRRRAAALLGFAFLAMLVGAGSRSDAALFSIVSVGVALGLRFGMLRTHLRLTMASLLIAAVAAGIFFQTGHAGAVSDGFTGYEAYEAVGLSDPRLLASNLIQVPALLLGNFGLGIQASLGSFDTPLPGLVGIGSVFTVMVAVFCGWATMWWQKAVALVGLGAASCAYPVLMLQETGIQIGIVFQPRYVLPLILVFVGVSMLGHRPRPLGMTRGQVAALTVALSIAHSAALHTNLTRYTHGTGPTNPVWPLDPEWWWGTVVPAPMIVWVAGSLAFAVVAAVVLGSCVWPRGPARVERQVNHAEV